MSNPAIAPEPPIEIQRAVLSHEIAMWTTTRYQCEVRLRVQKKIEGEREIIDGLIADLERCETALDALNAELDALGVAI